MTGLSSMSQALAVDEDATLVAIPGSASLAAADEITHALVLSEGGSVQRRVPVGMEPIMVGRVPPCDLVLDDSSVSRLHCRVQLMGDHVVVTDLKSTNGTFVDGSRVAGTVPLQHGAVLHAGSCALVYERRTQREIREALTIERDLQSASAYVQMLLPKAIHVGPVRANWLFLPCAQLGGNAFGYRFLDPSTFAGYMLDVAGQGTGAAMHSVAVMNLLRQPSIPGVDFSDPVSVLAGLDATFRPEDHNGAFFSIWYFVLDLPSRQLRYASAGHHPAFLVAHDRREALTLAADGPAIGLGAAGRGFMAMTTDAPPGSMLYMMSDGASESIERTSCGRGDPDCLQQLIRDAAQPGVPEPLQLYQLVRDAAAGPDGFDEDFSVVAFNL